jgi:predicted metal-dependent phosphoesterase TrpH
LTAAGLPGESLVEAALRSAAPTRAHVARALHTGGFARSMQRAFDLWLKRGRPGYVPARWSDLSTVMDCLKGAGGLPVLAHPHRCRISNGVLRELVAEFKTLGGAGIEVSLAGMAPSDADRAATLARRFDLAGSMGSDFHEPDLPWRPLGRFAKLADRVTPITAHLGWSPRRSQA